MRITTIPVGIMKTNCYIVESESKNAVVIDPGDDGARLADRITNMGVNVKYILLTHGHFDHIGAVKDVVKRTGAKVAVGAGDEDIMRDPTLVLNRVQSKFTEKYNVAPDIILNDGDEITLDELTFKVIATPGHTKGGVTYALENDLFTGDTLFYRTVGRTDLYGASKEAMISSLRKLGNLPRDYDVHPGHGDETTLDIERIVNPQLRRALGMENI